VIVVLLLGAGAGAGCWLVVRGLAPPRPSLAASLAQLRRTSHPAPRPVEQGTGFAARLGAPLARRLVRAGGGGMVGAKAQADLAVLGRSPERHLAEKAALALVGLLVVPAMAGVLAVAGGSLPFGLPLWGSLLLAAVGFVVPDLGVHAEAERRRQDFRHALGSFVDLVVIGLAGGGGVETALSDAAATGDGWAFERLRRALDDARLRRETPWTALDHLGAELGVAELSELAASVSLAGSEGAKVRVSLVARAASLRTHQLARAEADAQAATERMSLPMVFLFAGFLLVIGFPAVERVLGAV
jgi:tight adherence protein C